MELLIKIPKKFEQHFKQDAFEDSLHRLSADAHLIAGLYEQETAAMFIELFKNAVLISPHGRLIDADTLLETIRPDQENDNYSGCTFATVKALMRNHINAAQTIIPANNLKKE